MQFPHLLPLAFIPLTLSPDLEPVLSLHHFTGATDLDRPEADGLHHPEADYWLLPCKLLNTIY